MLIKNALSNLPVYFMSLYRVLSTVLHKLEKIRADFLWHSEKGHKKYHLVNWVQSCHPLEQGSLGF